MFIKSLLLSIFFLSTASLAQLVPANNIPNAAANAVVAALHSIKRSDVRADSISGHCTFKNSSCNGAHLVLFDKERAVFQTTLTSIDSFKIPNLKKFTTYKLTIEWPKHNVSEVKTVTTGEYVTIQLSERSH